MKLYTVSGTWDWDPPTNATRAWWEHGSRFDSAMEARGIAIVTRPWPPWGTGINGFGTTAAMRGWWVGAYTFAERLRNVPWKDRNVIVHSHAGQIVALMAMLPLEYRVALHSIVTVCTPVRRDLFSAYAEIGCPWLHLTDRSFRRNRMQIWGALWDRSFRVDWAMPAPAVTHIQPGIGHSQLLREPERWGGVFDGVLLPFWLAAGCRPGED